jgi:hypothetical protein
MNLAPAAPAPGDEFLTTEEAAKRLKRSVKTLEYWRQAGLGPPLLPPEARCPLPVERGPGLGSQLPRRPPEHGGLKPMARQGFRLSPRFFTIWRTC